MKKGKKGETEVIFFEDWILREDGKEVACQFDHLTRTLNVVGDIPDGWEWAMLVQVGKAMDIIPLTVTEGGLNAVLTARQLSVGGYYEMQLRAAQGERVKHTNVVHVYVSPSLSGDEKWPEIPSTFTELERRNAEYAGNAEKAASTAGSSAEKARAAAVQAGEFADLARQAVEQGGPLFANALKGTVSGATVRVDDVSPLEHSVSVKVSGVDDLTAVTLIKAGLNIWDEQWEFGSISSKGALVSVTDTIRSKNFIPVKAGVRLFFSLPQLARLIVYDTNKTFVSYNYPSSGKGFMPEQDGYVKFAVGGSVNSLAPITEYGNNICISVANDSTAAVYEPYKAEVYTPNEDGTVDGIIGNGEVMTLMTDTSGVNIECRYNKDINKAFERLTQAIIFMGGNI